MLRNYGVKVKVSLMVALLLLGTITPLLAGSKAFASGEAFSGGADVSGAVSQAIAIDDLSISGTGDDTLDVNIYVPNGTLQMSTMTGLTFTSATSGSELQFSGTRSAINAALATLTFTHNSPIEVTLQVTLGGADGEVYNPANGHVYQVVSTGGINWDDANTAALATEYNGSTGYLATITNQEESDFIVSRLDNDGWIGASDAATEGDWKWVVGPEAGTSFWSGGTGGSAVGGAFTNWDSPYQPDNAGEEECGQIVIGSSGRWNDLTCANTLTYYVVEFGAPGDLPTNASTEIEISITGPQISTNTCDELEAVDDDAGSQYADISLTADIDCEGREITSLFEGNPFQGSLDGNNHTIKNFVINKSDNSTAGLISETTSDVVISDLKLENVAVTASREAGSLVGLIDGEFTISNVHAQDVTITTTESGYAGGLVGDINASEGEQSELTNISAKGVVNASGNGSSNVGGLVGMLEAQRSTVTIHKVYADVDVVNDAEPISEFNESSDVGGLFGELEADNDSGEGDANETTVTLTDAYAWGNVVAENSLNVGGLVGRLDVEDDASDHVYITVENTYARGSVAGFGDVGGLIGHIDEADNSDVNYSVLSSFAMGELEELDDDELTGTGGLIGGLEAGDPDQLLSEDNYFDRQRTGQALCLTHMHFFD